MKTGFPKQGVQECLLEAKNDFYGSLPARGGRGGGDKLSQPQQGWIFPTYEAIFVPASFGKRHKTSSDLPRHQKFPEMKEGFLRIWRQKRGTAGSKRKRGAETQAENSLCKGGRRLPGHIRDRRLMRAPQILPSPCAIRKKRENGKMKFEIVRELGANGRHPWRVRGRYNIPFPRGWRAVCRELAKCRVLPVYAQIP